MTKSFSTVRVAVTQAEPVWLDLAGAVAKTCALIREAASHGAQLVAFPEVWIPGYPCWVWSRPVDFAMHVRYAQNALRLHSPEMDALRACARRHGVAVALGFAENDGADSLYIAQALLGADGELKMHRRKMKPTHMERTVFGDASGECLASVAALPHLGDDGVRVGQLSCWEHIQPLLKFNTISQREHIHVAAWPSLTPHSGPGGQDLWSMSAEGCQALSRTYAVEASAFVLHCTAVLTDKALAAHGTAGAALMGRPGGGSSAIFGPDGRKLNTEDLAPTAEGILYADLDLDEITRVRMFAHCTGHYSRPDLLWLATDPELKTVVRGPRAGAVPAVQVVGGQQGRQQQQQQQEEEDTREEIVVVEKGQQS